MTSYPTPGNHDHWWLTTPTWRRLHAIPADAYDWAAVCDRDPSGAPAVAACGQRAHYTMPGLLSRLGMPRCTWCCRALHIPAGDGTPANDHHRTAEEKPC